MKRACTRRTTVSEPMQAAAKALADKLGIRQLGLGEKRPEHYYAVSHLTGKPIVKDRNAVVRKPVTD